MINVKCSCSGYTLLEILAVVTIMGFSAALMASVFSDNVDQARLERTLESMAEIKKAILGTTTERVRGDITFAGYVPDMGELPRLCDVMGTPNDPADDQPKGLWTKDTKGTPDNKDDDLTLYQDYTVCDGLIAYKLTTKNFISLGWRGPYLKPPAGGVLTDGWGNPFTFEIDDKDFVIKSLGADGEREGGDYNRDLITTIKDKDYLASVAGYVCLHSMYTSKDDIERDERSFPGSGDVKRAMVHIYYKPKDSFCPPRSTTAGDRFDIWRCVAKELVEAKEDGYFHFDDIPIGTERLLAVTQAITDGGASVNIFQPYKIDVEPGINWLGNMGVVP
jgi:prepilin-type N-terminal cleavage/methylation domain-containing protein